MSITTPESQVVNPEKIRGNAIPLLDIYSELYKLNLNVSPQAKASDICVALGILSMPKSQEELVEGLDKFIDKFNPSKLFNELSDLGAAKQYWMQFDYIIKNGFAKLEEKLFGQPENSAPLKSEIYRREEFSDFPIG